MHVLKTDVPNIVINQFPDFLGCFALQDAGEPLIDPLPIERDGLGSDAQELRESSDYLILTSRIGLLQTRSRPRVRFPKDALPYEMRS